MAPVNFYIMDIPKINYDPKTDCTCVKGDICCRCHKSLEPKYEYVKRTDPYPEKNNDYKLHLLCNPCKDI